MVHGFSCRATDSRYLDTIALNGDHHFWLHFRMCFHPMDNHFLGTTLVHASVHVKPPLQSFLRSMDSHILDTIE